MARTIATHCLCSCNNGRMTTLLYQALYYMNHGRIEELICPTTPKKPIGMITISEMYATICLSS